MGDTEAVNGTSVPANYTHALHVMARRTRLTMRSSHLTSSNAAATRGVYPLTDR